MFRINNSSQVARKFKDARREKGLAYVAILILVAIMSTLGLSFLHMTVTGMRVALNRGEYIQADYLAETAVNHAMWRLLNEPGFPKKNDVYYMHSLGSDRYGYKVIRPTATTFAGIATVGAVGDNWVLQRNVPYIIPENVMTVYCDTNTWEHPYRRMVGASFDPPRPTFNIFINNVPWVELEGHPFSDEFVVALMDGANFVELGVWNGQSWGNLLTFLPGTSKKDHKCFDIAYDTYTGNALVFGYDDNQKGIVLYTVWDGSNWTAPAMAFDTGSGKEIRYIDAKGSPTSGEILIAVLDQDKDITLHRWDGTSFVKLVTLETDAALDTGMVVNITYEQQSGEAVIVWGQNGSAACKFVTWDGFSLSATNDLPPFTDDGQTIRMAADTTSDTILLMAIDKAKDVHAAVWDGSSWTDSYRFETDAEDTKYINCDAAWEGSGGEALAVWGNRSGAIVQYIRWVKGAALSSCTVENGPGFQDNIRSVRMCSLPGSDRIVLACNNKSEELRYSLWDGDRFRGNPALLLTAAQPSEERLPYDIDFSNYLAGPTAEPLPNPSISSNLCDGIVGYWELDETTGTVASDSSYNGHNGTLVNMDSVKRLGYGSHRGRLGLRWE